jgi:hypothetical protein
VGFDYRKNGRDNIAGGQEHRPPADKAYIDEIHRRFTQLQRTNPEVARLLEEGERINRRALIEKTATIAANLMDAAPAAPATWKRSWRMTPAGCAPRRAGKQVKLPPPRA